MTEQTPSLDRPGFRPLDMRRVQQNESSGIVLHDPTGISPAEVFIPEGLLPIVGLFDGVTNISQLAAQASKDTGQSVSPDFVRNLVADLDSHLVLYSPSFLQALAQQTQSFLGQGARPPRHAGTAGYPDREDNLRLALQSMVREVADPLRPSPRGLIAPHIDLYRGREGYAMAYGYLAESQPADLYVVFGTGHQGPSATVTGLSMDWQTPLGTLPTDQDFIKGIHARLGEPAAMDQFLHRDEHSLEFQMLFLAHLLQGRDVQVAGFLTGQLPQTEAEIQELLDAFSQQAQGRQVCFVAGADLAHLGPMFGDEAAVDQETLRQLRLQEEQSLQHLQAGDPMAFRQSIVGPGNPNRVCGTTPILLAASLAGGQGELLHYGQAKSDDGSQVVSFCSMAFTG